MPHNQEPPVTSRGAPLEVDSMGRGALCGTVRVRYFAGARAVFGATEVEVSLGSPPTIGCLLQRVCDTSGRRQALLDAVSGAPRVDLAVLVNGNHIAFIGGADAVLQAGDVVSVFPPLYGG